jgi:hypothetical protein
MLSSWTEDWQDAHLHISDESLFICSDDATRAFTARERAHASSAYRRTERDLPKVYDGLPIRWRTNRNVPPTGSHYICPSYKRGSTKRWLDGLTATHVRFRGTDPAPFGPADRDRPPCGRRHSHKIAGFINMDQFEIHIVTITKKWGVDSDKERCWEADARLVLPAHDQVAALAPSGLAGVTIVVLG